MSNQSTAKVTKTARQTAIIRFMDDGSLDLKLTGIDGLTGRMLDNVQNALYKEVNRLRAEKRNKELQKRLKDEADRKAKEAEEAANKTEVKS
jgi:hypothetical protein